MFFWPDSRQHQNLRAVDNATGNNNLFSRVNYVFHVVSYKGNTNCFFVFYQDLCLHSESGNCIDKRLKTKVYEKLKIDWTEHTFVTWEFVDTWRLGRFIAGLRNALAVLHLSPFLTVSWPKQNPSFIIENIKEN